MPKIFSITTTLPYVNGIPHIGFALEIIEADVCARYHALLGEKVFFNTGTDEHGVNIYEKARESAKAPQEYVDEMSEQFKALQELLNLSYTHFVRTTDAAHKEAAQEFWKKADAAGDIYEKEYQVKYCTGCELEKTDSELDKEGRCLLHPTKEIEIREEENYFFRFSKYQEKLLELYQSRPDFVLPANRQKEIENFVKKGLTDFSISRLKEKMPWGVAVPGDESHVMYVWFDALVNYISTFGWPDTTGEFTQAWPAVQIAGKDNLRQQAAMWQAMLFSAGLEPSRQVLINGFINIDGQKMSKTLGNIITPLEMVERYGTDGTRYLLLSLGPIGEDFDVTWERLDEKYNADLANGLGNLVSRVLKLSESLDSLPEASIARLTPNDLLDSYQIATFMETIWAEVHKANKLMDEKKPWIQVKEDTESFRNTMKELFELLAVITLLLQPILPETAEKIETALKTGKVEPLFKRIT